MNELFALAESEGYGTCADAVVGVTQGESGEAPPAADKANRFRGSGTIGGPDRAGNRKAATVLACSPLTYYRMMMESRSGPTET